jgi:hypothetical protein
MKTSTLGHSAAAVISAGGRQMRSVQASTVTPTAVKHIT